ncbi:hypothetical protein J7L13_02430 [bacterium]|nr:hypothetical protein [bacterium]
MQIVIFPKDKIKREVATAVFPEIFKRFTEKFRDNSWILECGSKFLVEWYSTFLHTWEVEPKYAEQVQKDQRHYSELDALRDIRDTLLDDLEWRAKNQQLTWSIDVTDEMVPFIKKIFWELEQNLIATL